MSEIISDARLKAMEHLAHESQGEVGESSVVEETFSEDQMEEVRTKMFYEIRQVISGISGDLSQDGWDTEVNFIDGGGYMEVIFKEDEKVSFEIIFSIGQHDGKRDDGIEPMGLSFDTEGVKFNVTISSSADDRLFTGIGSYRGVLEVTKKIVDAHLYQHFIDLFSQAGSEI